MIGLDIVYGKGESRKATLTKWRTNLLHTPDGDELQTVPEIADKVCYVIHSVALLFDI